MDCHSHKGDYCQLWISGDTQAAHAVRHRASPTPTAAGYPGKPKLLMLSDIGTAQHLQQLGIQVPTPKLLTLSGIGPAQHLVLQQLGIQVQSALIQLILCTRTPCVSEESAKLSNVTACPPGAG